MFLENGLPHCDDDVEVTNYFFRILENRFELDDNYVFPYKYPMAERYFPMNVLSFEFLAEWFEKLKMENVYDNTKIIIASDHGFPVKTKNFTGFPNLIPNPQLEADENDSNLFAFFNPLLLVKDFNDVGEVRTSYEFMTNADVPAIAVSHLPENLRKNPFSGKEISSKEKNAGVNVCTSGKFYFSAHGKYKFDIKKDEIVNVKDDIFDVRNWTKVDYIK